MLSDKADCKMSTFPLLAGRRIVVARRPYNPFGEAEDASASTKWSMAAQIFFSVILILKISYKDKFYHNFSNYWICIH